MTRRPSYRSSKTMPPGPARATPSWRNLRPGRVSLIWRGSPIRRRRRVTAVEHNLDPVIDPRHTYGSVTDHILHHVRKPVTRTWLIGIAITLALFMAFNVAVAWLFIWGVGVWGINIPVAWGFAIVNFVWWIGIGHAGTFIS